MQTENQIGYQYGCQCGCQCGEVSYQVTGKPLLRAICHCTICQAANKAAYSDILLFRVHDVTQPAEGTVDYRSVKFPPILQRGYCHACQQLSIEYLQLFPIPKTIFVPTRRIADQSIVPAPSLHIFYDKRVADIDDALPKYQGYLASQLAFAKHLIPALWRGQ
ncbi:GFA family protein [Thalassotalea euphylliae]|uniref:CENP-V/GFA domain-containing protein n=1 Tax=Thalassotalea euphylliae TaxID=1655234 RepID=A0A3E0TZK8_9GAMM|nr:GFA family protein [Thalassotalea euphylliae]REL29292.1 hypothetical protein DXX94_00280 [Thalassotalea euphylliae]